MKNYQIVSVNKLQSDVSKIIKDVEKGKTYHVMRYSKPVAVLVSANEYECLSGQCKGCMKELFKEIQKQKKGK